MASPDATLRAFRLSGSSSISLRRAGAERVWMKDTQQSFANRCLPMRIASQAGWWVITEKRVRAFWSGARDKDGLTIERDDDGTAVSHFGHGILTFPLPFLFRTSPGTALLLRGPANLPKDGASALEAIVETDWSVAGMSLNWQLTRPHAWIRFDPGEPIGMIVPHDLGRLECLRPDLAPLAAEPDLKRGYAAWRKSNQLFSERLERRDPKAVRQGWQRYYFNGVGPGQTASDDPAAGHRTALSLAEFEEADDGPPD